MTPGEIRFEPVTFADLPGWADDNHLDAFRAFLRSCERVIASVRSGGAGGRTPAPPALLAACDEAMTLAGKRVTAAKARKFLEEAFVPHRVVHAGGEGLMTGYYEPLLEGSRTREGRFQHPLYRRPPDLVNLVEESLRGARGSELTHARKTEKGIEPFATRAEIDAGALDGKGLELIYLADPVDNFFLQVQGSGRIKLTDGTYVRVGYDGKNGHPYSSIGRHLIDAGLFPADRMSLQALGDWLRKDLARAREVMRHNASFVFFREHTGKKMEGPVGVLDIQLTPYRSLAVDAGFHVVGTPIYVVAPTLTHAGLKGQGFQRLMVAQDVGSAIKGPERGDIYFGSGPAAGRKAGITKHPGRFYALLPYGVQPALQTRARAAEPTAKAPPPAVPGGKTGRP